MARRGRHETQEERERLIRQAEWSARHERGETWADIGADEGLGRDAIRQQVYSYRSKIASGEVGGLSAPPPETYNPVGTPIPADELFPDWVQPEDVDWREWFDAWEDQLELLKRIDPAQETLTVDLSRIDRPIAMVSASDLHMGGGYTNHAEIRRTIEYILETPDLYVGICGDTIEGFLPGMKSAETIEQQPSGIKAQLKALKSLTAELTDAGKLWYMTWGDHDARWFEQLIGYNVAKHEIHSRVPYFTGRGIVRLLLGEQTYWITVNHAERFASQWNLNHPQRKQYSTFMPSDLNISGHRHKPAFQMAYDYEVLRELGLGLGGKHWLIANGTWKTGPDSYTIRSWTRGIIGCPTVVFQPGYHDTDVLETPEKAVAFLRGGAGR